MKLASLVLAATVMISASAATARGESIYDDTPSAGEMIFDLVLLRPLGLVATAIGAGVYVVALPIALMRGEGPSEPAEQLVVGPARFTFTRPLGREE
jgi:hypothetical protein